MTEGHGSMGGDEEGVRPDVGHSFALLGSGEFEPWTEEIDRWLLERAEGDGTVLILPTASSPEGDDVFDRWAKMGLDHYARLGLAAEVLPVKTRADAERSGLVERLRTASVAYFSGGNPAYLAGVLAGSAFWSTLLDRARRGLAYAGCSAGIACLGERAIDSAAHQRGERDIWKPGLGLFPKAVLAPHWDALDTFLPGLQAMFVASIPPGFRLLAVDERTAMIGDGTRWRVVGAGGVSLIREGRREDHPAGSEFEAALSP